MLSFVKEKQKHLLISAQHVQGKRGKAFQDMHRRKQRIAPTLEWMLTNTFIALWNSWCSKFAVMFCPPQHLLIAVSVLSIVLLTWTLESNTIRAAEFGNRPNLFMSTEIPNLTISHLPSSDKSLSESLEILSYSCQVKTEYGMFLYFYCLQA